MTLNGAIKQLHELRCNEDVPAYVKPAIAEVINTLLMDTQEVRHGRWIKTECGRCVCSVCGAENYYAFCQDKDGNMQLQDKFCPNCGASMMDEVEE